MRRAAVIVSVAALAAAGASEAVAKRGAAASAPAPVKIGGPRKLRAAKVLTFPIFVSADSFVKVRGTLRLPGPNLRVQLGGVIRQGQPREVKLTLNSVARDDLKANFRVSSLKIVASARNLDTGVRHTARKTFRFKL
ncbi:MAG: hypothetical protein U0R52_06390 [Solirubrobacterales bacterium]